MIGFIIFCSILGLVGLGVGLNASLANGTFENETTTSPHIVSTTVATTSTAEVSKKNPNWLKPETFVAFLGAFSSRLSRLLPDSIGASSQIIPSTTDTTVVIRSMERLEITSQHSTNWNSWSECIPTNSCLDADSSGEMCPVRTRFGSVTINETDIEVRQESSDECECEPCPRTPTWGSWSKCTPDHNCLDTIAAGETCPIRTRSGRVWTNGTFIDVESETTDGCNCEPCSFRLTDWVGGDCTRDAVINGGDGDCPCHWTEYRYCQQLSNGTCSNNVARKTILFYF